MILLIASLTLSACSRNGEAVPVAEDGDVYTLQTRAFLDFFDTLILLRIFVQSQEELDTYTQMIYEEFRRLHMLFDIYNEHEGVNNLWTINQNAGIAPVYVDDSIISMLRFGIWAYEASGGALNIAMGSVLSLWHEFRGGADQSPPGMDVLTAAAQHMNIEDIIIDEAAGTVFLRDPYMSLDVGALAKGYAIERAAEVAVAAGVRSGVISVGGDMRLIGAPLDGRETWNVGVTNPHDTDNILDPGTIDVVSIADVAMVTSGDYHRMIEYDGVRYHHIIDPATLMPTWRYTAITVIHRDGVLANFLSTAAFIMPLEDAIEMITYHGGDALVIFHDGTVYMTDGYKAVSQNLSP